MSAVTIESLDQEGRGVAHVDGKVVFIEGALPGERVTFRIHKEKAHFAQASVDQVLRSNALRVTPRCPHFGECGGCSMQHLDASAQTAVKQRVLEDALMHVGKLRAETVLPAIHGSAWGYRFRARLTVRVVPSKGGVLLGFHQKRSTYVADIHECAVLPPHVSAMLRPLHRLIAKLSIADRVPQIEVAVSEAVTVLVFRHLLPFSAQDKQHLRDFADQYGVQVWLQPQGPDSAHVLHPREAAQLSYALPEFDVNLAYKPSDFTQVNPYINQLLIRRALQLLKPAAGERIADLFCGLGNFTLPIARSGAYVIGIEGSDALVQRARANAKAHGLHDRTEFHTVNLFETTEDSLEALGPLDKLLIDPPREGAIAVVKALSPAQSPATIVYVSCNPATLARDAAVLVHEKGYRLHSAGIANMFPQTSHVESVALFKRVT
jgi:23S rRNA (uracil1939-C5)-methyltransferase